METCEVSVAMCGGGFEDGWVWDSCEHCPVGRRMDIDGNCCSCPPGKYQSEWATTTPVCTLCEAGKYQMDFLQIECDVCPKGKFAFEPGQNECREAELGRYVGDSSDPKDHFMSVACPAGKYTDQKGMNSCIDCLPGTFLPPTNEEEPVASVSEDLCQVCPKGTFSLLGSPFCSICASGFVSLEPRSGFCDACRAGTYNGDNSTTVSLHDDLNDCVECMQGMFSPAGAPSCQTCSAGKYSTVGLESCISCPKGTTITDNSLEPGRHAGEESCRVCESGKYMDELGSPGPCIDCPLGKFLADEVTKELHIHVLSCKVCESGRYAAAKGKSSCSFCKAGKYLNDDGEEAYEHTSVTKCSECEAGKFSVEGSSTCLMCQAGRYNDQEGAR